MAETPAFDLLVIGAGSGGIACARRAAAHGAKVAVVERAALGGTCVNVGCVPKKLSLLAGSFRELMHMAPHFGYPQGAPLPQLDWAAFKAKRDAEVRRLNGIYSTNLLKSGVTLFEGDAAFSGPSSLRVRGVGGDTQVSAARVLVACGGRPAVPDVPGKELAITSDGFFELEQQPRRVAVVGAGYIAVELAGIFNALGTETTVLCRGDRTMRRFDPLVRDTLHDEMLAAGVTVRGGSEVASLARAADGAGITVTLKDGGELTVDQVLFAIGREPVTASLNLEAAGVAVNARGYIQVDRFQQTSAAPVLALGDACGQWELTPVAIAAGRLLADRLYDGRDGAHLQYENIPTVVFSHPPIGTVGLTESEARAAHPADGDITIYTSKFPNMFYSLMPRDGSVHRPLTAMKVICQGPQQRVVGLHVVGLGADEMMQGFGVAVRMGCTKADLDSCVAIHPTASEELVTMQPWAPRSRAPVAAAAVPPAVSAASPPALVAAPGAVPAASHGWKCWALSGVAVAAVAGAAFAAGRRTRS